MKKLILILGVLLGMFQVLYAGQSKLYPISGPSQLECCSQNMFTVDVENINPTFAIQNINGKWVVKRQKQIIYEETDYPEDPSLDPGQITTFEMEIPMELLVLDGLLEIVFEFNSDFDLNPDPSVTKAVAVAGCGIVRQLAVEFMLTHYLLTAEEQQAYIFLFEQLLKPGTLITGSNGTQFSTTLEAFSWLGMIYDPDKRFEQPVILFVLNSNTQEVDSINANWYPLIDGEPFYPAITDASRISGDPPIVITPPKPFTFDPVASMPVDSVCAILVSGTDRESNIQESFERDVDLMKGYFTHHPNGPRLPDETLLIRKSKNGYNRDSLKMDLLKLKDKYTKVYFYYSGHGSETDGMCLGDDPAGWADYQSFTDDLFDSGANRYCIMIDACYSGRIIDKVNANPHLPDIDVEVITSADEIHQSAATVWTVDGMNKYFGKFTSQFFWAAGEDANDTNKDGKVSLLEGYNKIDEDNFADIVTYQSPMRRNVRNYTLKKQGQVLYNKAEGLYGDQVNSAMIRLDPTVFPTGSLVKSFDLEYEYTLQANSYVGFIEWENRATFGKQVTYGFVDAGSGQVEFHDGPTFWPTMPDFPEYKPFRQDYIYLTGANYLTDKVDSTVYEVTQIQPVISETDLAIVVTGDHEDRLMRKSFRKTGDIIISNLKFEKLGAQLHPDNIRYYECISGSELIDIFDSIILENKFKKINFQYIGNISRTGYLALGDGPNEWIRIQTVFDKLAAVGADRYDIVLDGSYSGLAFDYLKANSVFADKQVNLITSSSNSLPAFAELYFDSVATRTSGVSSFTYHLMQQYGNPESESDGLEGTTFKESFNQLYIRNPRKSGGKRLFQLSAPTNFTGASYETPGNEPFNIYFTGLDLGINAYLRSSQELDIYASQELNIRPQTSSSSNVFEIFPVRQWKIEGAWDFDPSLAADLLFYYHEAIDSLSGTEGVLGLVSRTSPDQEWEAYYPVEYNETESILTAKDVTELREWAVARVQEISRVNDPIEGLSAVQVYPNPATEKINISFELDEASELSTRIINLNGQVMYTGECNTFSSGKQLIVIDLVDQLSGIYFVEVTGGRGKLYIPVIVK